MPDVSVTKLGFCLDFCSCFAYFLFGFVLFSFFFFSFILFIYLYIISITVFVLCKDVEKTDGVSVSSTFKILA